MKKLAKFNKNKEYRNKQYAQLAQIGAIAGGAKLGLMGAEKMPTSQPNSAVARVLGDALLPSLIVGSIYRRNKSKNRSETSKTIDRTTDGLLVGGYGGYANNVIQNKRANNIEIQRNKLTKKINNNFEQGYSSQTKDLNKLSKQNKFIDNYKGGLQNPKFGKRIVAGAIGGALASNIVRGTLDKNKN